MIWDTKYIAKFEKNGFVMNINFKKKYDNHIFFCNRHALSSRGQKPVYEREDIDNNILKFLKGDTEFDQIILVNPSVKTNEGGFVDLVGFLLPPENDFENLQKVEIEKIVTTSNSLVVKGIKTTSCKTHEFPACRKNHENPTYDDVIEGSFKKGVSGSLVGLYDDKQNQFIPWAAHEAGSGTYGIGVSLYDFLSQAEVVESVPPSPPPSPPPKKKQKTTPGVVVDLSQKERKYRKKNGKKRLSTSGKRSRSKKTQRRA